MEYYGTLGPTCCEPTILKKMFDAGMTGIRLNLSHSSLEGSHAWIYHYFEAAKQTKGEKKLMIDLIGPELRIGYLEGDMGLSTGAHVVIGHGGILVPEEIMPHIRRDQEILLDDGKIKLIAERKISPRSWRCRIVCGGVLTARKSIALPGCNINNPTLTEADLKNLSLAKQYQVTDVMLPFVRNKEDLIILREALKQNNSEDIRIFAKIENMTGVEHLEELLPYCDYIVIARGDLGNVMPLSKLPKVQAYIAKVCKEHNKNFMVVTQMLDSMIRNPYPTRAEVNDIYHAVHQGANDADGGNRSRQISGRSYEDVSRNRKWEFRRIMMNKKWWHNKVAYQIYPKSFKDTNGDGIGDIPGIISKLDYLKDLGVDILWISPMYQSPMVDNGYDISDYYAIDPMFGSMDEMKQLIKEAKKRNMYILMDLVVNHCSSEHEWFQKAMADPEGEYGSYFYIKDGKDGQPPTNWRSYFGGSVWEKIPGYDNKFYLHSFAKEQPDLNWENETVREKIYEMICWWMDQGLSGFRIDAIMNIKKDLTWSDLKPDGPDGLADVYKITGKVEGIGDFLMEMKHRCFEPYDALTVGEAMFVKEDILPQFIGEDGYFSTIFAFEPCHAYRKGKNYMNYDWPQPFDEWREETFHNQEIVAKAGFEANIIENHDQPRGASLFIPEEDYGFYSLSALATIIFCERGLPFLYQGQEIGMSNRQWKYDEFNDLETINQYQIALKAGMSKEQALEIARHHSRDNARTPMQWSSEENAGFSKGKPWMPVNENYKVVNVAEEEKEYGSILNFYKRLIAFYKSEEYNEILTYGDFRPIYEKEDHIFAYSRSYGCQKLVLICNFSSKEKDIELSEDYENVVFVNYEQTTVIGNTLKMKPYECVIYEM